MKFSIGSARVAEYFFEILISDNCYVGLYTDRLSNHGAYSVFAEGYRAGSQWGNL